MSFKMDTDSFLNTISGMASQRGTPEVLFSDNGGNFVEADKELKDLVKQGSKEDQADNSKQRSSMIIQSSSSTTFL